jgi:hypothetical protein
MAAAKKENNGMAYQHGVMAASIGYGENNIMAIKSIEKRQLK